MILAQYVRTVFSKKIVLIAVIERLGFRESTDN